MSTHGPDLEDKREADSLTAIPEGPGAALRAARESKGYSLQDVSERLRLNKAIIENIEDNEFGNGTALVFVRGYLRAYAEHLQLDSEPVIAAFETLGLSEERNITKIVKANKNREAKFKIPVSMACKPPVLWGSVAAMVIALTGILWVYVGDSSRLSTTAEAEVSTPLQELTAAKVADGEEPSAADAEDITAAENTVAIIPGDSNPQAEALLF